MIEKTLHLDTKDTLSIYGANDIRLEQIKTYFPTLKIIARGIDLKVLGQEDEINKLESKLKQLVRYAELYGALTANHIDAILGKEGAASTSETAAPTLGADVLVYGNNGLVIKPKNPTQHKLVDSAKKHDMLFALGPAGTGKTYIAVALAVKALKAKQVKRIILTRPAVEAGENLGFLPGDLKEKLDPYMQPLYDALFDMITTEKLKEYLENGTIQIAPLAFMRGRTLSNAFVILDEAQNTTESQMKMFLTRMGHSAKFIITGDLTQIDLPKNQQSGLVKTVQMVRGIEGIDVIEFEAKEGLRHPLVTKILKAYGE